jgi:hypothetical protein
VDDVKWRLAPVYSVLFSSFVKACFKGERRGSTCSPSSIEYRYSPSVSPSSHFYPFFLSKNSVGFVFLFSRALRHHMPSFSFASPLDSLIAPTNKPLDRSVSHMHIVSYRTIFQYVYLSSKKLTNLFAQIVKLRYMYVFEADSDDLQDLTRSCRHR